MEQNKTSPTSILFRLTGDVKNAFGVPYRNWMCKIIMEYTPELCGIFRSTYGNTSFLYKGYSQFAEECAYETYYFFKWHLQQILQ